MSGRKGGVKAVTSVRRVGRGRRGEEKDVGKKEESKNKKKMEKSCGGSGNKRCARIASKHPIFWCTLTLSPSLALCSLPHTCLEACLPIVYVHMQWPRARARGYTMCMHVV